jgi:NAD(P)-dependent dehydrogenase (short-subunit alcohol dehydrogenase family)
MTYTAPLFESALPVAWDSRPSTREILLCADRERVAIECERRAERAVGDRIRRFELRELLSMNRGVRATSARVSRSLDCRETGERRWRRMKDFRDKLAVITGAGTGMGRELALALVEAGAHVAICDVFDDHLADAQAACESAARVGNDAHTRVSAHHCDVADEAQVIAFRDAVLQAHATDHIDLLFNNAGITGGGSFIREDRTRWERTFNVCWFGVYYCTRAFMPLLIKSRESCIINTSSVNGFFALDPSGPHTAYSTAKFAIKGFSEALISDLRTHAPHVSVALVMPGHIGTSIIANSQRIQGTHAPSEMTAEELSDVRARLTQLQAPHVQLDDEQVRALVQNYIDRFRDHAPLSAAEAAAIILEGVRAGRWRILVGKDAHLLDRAAREHPEELYDLEFLKRMRAEWAKQP